MFLPTLLLVALGGVLRVRADKPEESVRGRYPSANPDRFASRMTAMGRRPAVLEAAPHLKDSGRAAWRFDIHLLLEAVRKGADFDVSL